MPICRHFTEACKDTGPFEPSSPAMTEEARARTAKTINEVGLEIARTAAILGNPRVILRLFSRNGFLVFLAGNLATGQGGRGRVDGDQERRRPDPVTLVAGKEGGVIERA